MPRQLSEILLSRLILLEPGISVAIQGAKEIDYITLSDGTAEVTVEITLGTVETILGRKIQL